MSNSVTPQAAAHLPVHHQLPETAQTHVHQVGAAIQPSHPLSPKRRSGERREQKLNSAIAHLETGTRMNSQ